MSRPPKKRCAVYGQNIVPDPLVDPGNPPHRHQACTAAHPTRAHHRMVTLAKSSPSRGAPLPSQKESATVMLELPDPLGENFTGAPAFSDRITVRCDKANRSGE